MTFWQATLSLLTFTLAVTLGADAHAWEMSGKKSVILHTRDGADIPIGSVVFTPDGETTRYKLSIDESKMKSFFLSMRGFKCLEGAEIQCYVPYPYDHPHVVTSKDLAWLEHDLLFFFKAPKDYGAKMQNGLIYALKFTDKGIVGRPQAIDIDKISFPPADPKTPPYQAADRDDINPGSRWIDSLKIE